ARTPHLGPTPSLIPLPPSWSGIRLGRGFRLLVGRRLRGWYGAARGVTGARPLDAHSRRGEAQRTRLPPSAARRATVRSSRRSPPHAARRIASSRLFLEEGRSPATRGPRCPAGRTAGRLRAAHELRATLTQTSPGLRSSRYWLGRRRCEHVG